MSKEHIISDWITDYLRAMVPGVAHKTERSQSGSHMPTHSIMYDNPALEVAVKAVCQRCNSTWMNRWEEAAEPILRPLIHDQPRTLTLAEQAILSSWATLMFIVLDYANRGSWREMGHFFTEQNRHQFATDRLPQTELFIGRYEDPSSAWLGTYDMTWIPRREPRIETRATTAALAMGKVVIFMIGAQWSNVHALYNISRFGRSIVHFYPLRGDLSWPPPEPLNRTQVWEFLEWWRLHPPKSRLLRPAAP